MEKGKEAEASQREEESTGWEEVEAAHDRAAEASEVAPKPSEEEPTAPEGEKAEEEEEKKEKAKINVEKSNLGRKVKTIEETMSKVLEKLENLGGSRETKATVEEMKTRLKDDDYILTVGDLRVAQKQLREEEEEQLSKQNEAYFKTLDDLGEGIDEDYYNAVIGELKKNHNKRRTGDPVNDAVFNYQAAENALLRKQLGSKGSPFDKNEDEEHGPLGAGPKGSKKVKGKAPIKLSPAAAEFVRNRQMSDDDVVKALG